MNTIETSSGLTKKNLSARDEVEDPYLITGKRSSLYPGVPIKKPKRSSAIFDMKAIEEAK